MQDGEQPGDGRTYVYPPNLAVIDFQWSGQTPIARSMREGAVLQLETPLQFGRTSDEFVVKLIVAHVVKRDAAGHHQTKEADQPRLRLHGGGWRRHGSSRQRHSGDSSERQEGQKFEANVREQAEIVTDLLILGPKILHVRTTRILLIRHDG